MDIRTDLRPYLEVIRSDIGETAHLMVLEGGDALFLDSVESTKALRTSSRVGRRYPAHTTSGGKVLLAELARERLVELYPTDRLPAVTARSITRRAELLRELETVRERGYGTNIGESEPDVAAIAVAVRGAAGEARAAIALSAPFSRLEEAAVPAIAAVLRRVADEAAARLP